MYNRKNQKGEVWTSERDLDDQGLETRMRTLHGQKRADMDCALIDRIEQQRTESVAYWLGSNLEYTVES